jgi:hypothetical protein
MELFFVLGDGMITYGKSLINGSFYRKMIYKFAPKNGCIGNIKRALRSEAYG